MKKIKTGITSKLSGEFIDEIMRNGISISFKNYADEVEIMRISEEEKEKILERYESNDELYLFGDWILENGKYNHFIDGPYGYALSFDTGSNVACVEYSDKTKLCAKTSPCYVMSNGSGFCGDLDNDGDNELAYTIADDCFYSEELGEY